MCILTRYSVRDRKYAKKRVVLLADIPNYEVNVPRGDGQTQEYFWWPVVKLEFHEGAIETLGQTLPKDMMYLVCVYQAMEEKVVAWAMTASQQIHEEVYKVP